MALAGPNPLLLCAGRRGVDTSDILTANATAADGSAWGSLSAFSNQSGTNDSSLSTALSAAQPAFVLGGANSDASVLRFRRASDAAGTLWNTQYTVLDGAVKPVGDWNSLAIVGGKPCVAYFGPGSDLRFIRANDSSGNQWEAPQTIASAGSVGQDCQLLDMGGVPVVLYLDYSQNMLKSASFY
jgi:hypothetical protein